MGRMAKDLTGQIFGRLTVIGPAEKIGRNATSQCRCRCGVEKVIMNFNLLSGQTQSCGCLQKERTSARVRKNPPRLKHGHRHTITYNSWQGMISRCLNQNDTNYPRYGGRGITVCRRWADPDKGLLNFVEDMGERPSPAHSIDRIDGTKNYEPSNCRWATRAQQNQNVDLKKSNITGYKGISATGFRWKAEIRCEGRRLHLGSYDTREEAALAYNIAAGELHGPYAVPNTLPAIDRKTTKRVFSQVMKIVKPEQNKGD